MTILFCIIQTLSKVVLVAISILLLILLLPGLPPYTTFESYNLTPALKLEGNLKINSKLDKAEAILDDDIKGAESIVVLGDGAVITGIADGRIIKYKDGKTSLIARTGEAYSGGQSTQSCGRPLGLRLDSAGNLLVADAYQGILRVNLETDEVEHLFPLDDPIDGVAPGLPDDLDVDKDGVIYWSDASSFPIQDIIVDALGNVGTGRLIKFDSKFKKNTILLDNLRFANGVQLSEKQDFVLVCESFKARVLRYFLKGPKSGQWDVFIDGLPGIPDNIRSNGKDGYYVSLVAPRDVFDDLGPKPMVRKLALRIQRILLGLVSWLESLFPEYKDLMELEEYILKLGPFEVKSSYATIVELNGEGQITNSYHSSGKVAEISQITLSPTGDFAYLGSPYRPKLWRIKMSELK